MARDMVPSLPEWNKGEDGKELHSSFTAKRTVTEMIVRTVREHPVPLRAPDPKNV